LPPLCSLNSTFIDPVDEGLPGYVDILEASSKLEDQSLEITFRLREFPSNLSINQARYGNIEYAWRGGVDIDRNVKTGLASLDGAEYIIQVTYIQESYTPKTGSIEELLEGSVWRATSSTRYRSQGKAKLLVDKDQGLVTIRGAIPGLPPDAYIHLSTYAYNPGGDPFIDQVDCRRE
jgi:hypothetical protein